MTILLGRLTKASVADGANRSVTLADAQAYVQDDDARIEPALVAAIARAESWTSQAFDIATYTLPYRNAQGGENILLPEWNGIVQPSKPSGTMLRFGSPVITLPEELDADGDIQFQAGGGASADVQEAIKYLTLLYFENTGAQVPVLVMQTLNSKGRGITNSRRPCVLSSFRDGQYPYTY